MNRCQALMIAAPASGQGKTTVVAGLARHLRNQGQRVRVFKMGPDFIDPMIHERAGSAPVYQLDAWMMGEDHCRALLADAARDCDWLLLESVMGLYDGHPSSAEFSRRLGIPVVLLIDGAAMAQTFGALAYGLSQYQHLHCAGVIANKVNSLGHATLLRQSLPGNLHWIGHLPATPDIALPERHLGLVTAADIDDLETRLDACARWIADAGLHLPESPWQAPTAPANPLLPDPRLQGLRIAIARDEAFCFLYPANLEWLQRSGARLAFFSPLRDQELPPADAIYLPGGYPELHLTTLAANTRLRNQIRTHFLADTPIVAECGGFLYLLETLAHHDGEQADMVGLIPGHGRVNQRLAGIGMHAFNTDQGEIRGHAFHYGEWLNGPTAQWQTTPARNTGQGETVYQDRRLIASFAHWYFPSAPAVAAHWLLP